MSRDTLVRCNDCGREERVDFSRSMQFGWPKCFCRNAVYGYTMTLVRTDANVGEATSAALNAQIGARRG